MTQEAYALVKTQLTVIAPLSISWVKQQKGKL